MIVDMRKPLSTPSNDPDRIPKEIYWKEYEEVYTQLPLKNMIIVDIGADYGSSPEWFLSLGAHRVIAFESDPELVSEMTRRFLDDWRVKINGAWNGEEVAGDILKIDCEGCEQNLTTKYLERFKAFAVALHKYWIQPDKYAELKAYMLLKGARMVQDLDKEELFVYAPNTA
jgi:hypothetical protein